jgi:hypothetical protein
MNRYFLSPVLFKLAMIPSQIYRFILVSLLAISDKKVQLGLLMGLMFLF